MLEAERGCLNISLSTDLYVLVVNGRTHIRVNTGLQENIRLSIPVEERESQYTIWQD